MGKKQVLLVSLVVVAVLGNGIGLYLLKNGLISTIVSLQGNTDCCLENGGTSDACGNSAVGRHKNSW